MIIIGYPGIGKSSNASPENKTIDLESSNFWVDGKKDNDNWYKIYGNIAEDLSRQGYTVFISSHAAVQSWLEDSQETVVAIAPSLDLKDQWIDRLHERYLKTKEDGDLKAWMRAKSHYEEDVDAITQARNTVMLESMDYDLMSVVDRLRAMEEERRGSCILLSNL